MFSMQVHAENLQFMQNRDVYNHDYFKFILNLASCNVSFSALLSYTCIILSYTRHISKKKNVGENCKRRLSNGDCTTEKFFKISLVGFTSRENGD